MGAWSWAERGPGTSGSAALRARKFRVCGPREALADLGYAVAATLSWDATMLLAIAPRVAAGAGLPAQGRGAGRAPVLGRCRCLVGPARGCRHRAGLLQAGEVCAEGDGVSVPGAPRAGPVPAEQRQHPGVARKHLAAPIPPRRPAAGAAGAAPRKDRAHRAAGHIHVASKPHLMLQRKTPVSYLPTATASRPGRGVLPRSGRGRQPTAP